MIDQMFKPVLFLFYGIFIHMISFLYTVPAALFSYGISFCRFVWKPWFVSQQKFSQCLFIIRSRRFYCHQCLTDLVFFLGQVNCLAYLLFLIESICYKHLTVDQQFIGCVFTCLHFLKTKVKFLSCFYTDGYFYIPLTPCSLLIVKTYLTKGVLIRMKN